MHENVRGCGIMDNVLLCAFLYFFFFTFYNEDICIYIIFNKEIISFNVK